ncbi:MAG: WG repeat-containing protein [Oscillospiraceae bacterium]
MYPEANLIITTMDAWQGILYGGADTVIDLKGKTKVPPVPDLSNDTFWYDREYQLLATPNGVYKATGKKILSHNGGVGGVSMGTGCAIISSVGDYIKTQGGYYAITKYIADYKGNVLNLTKRMNWPLREEFGDAKIQQTSDLSDTGTLWVQNNEKKWGLLDMTGKEILPFVYDAVYHGAWAGKDLCYAIVTQNGKQGIIGPKGESLTPIEYTNFVPIRAKTYIEAWKGDKVGLVDPKTGKVTLPVKYDKVGLFDANYQWNPDYFATGSCAARIGKDLVFVDRAGNEVYTRKHSETNTELKLTIEAQDGLYQAHEGLLDSRGRVIVPDTLLRNATFDFATSTVVFQKDGKVYRQSANGFDKNYTPKPYAPATATALPSATKLMVNGKTVAADAYNIGGNNYIKLRDLATMVSGTEKNFEVGWNGAINLISNTAYTPVGGEMAQGSGQRKAAQRNTAKIYLNNGLVAMTAYNIGGTNYFKLRDVMQTFDIGVGYENGTATVNTSQPYTPVGDAQKYQQADIKAYMEAVKNLDADGTIKQWQVYKEPVITCTSTPTKLEYTVGEAFDSAGFKAQHQDIYGNGTNISAEFTFDVNGTPIATGYVFKEAGKKTVNCTYKGKVINSFLVNVFEKKAAKDLPLTDGGSYDIKLMGKYLTIVNGKWMVLGSEKPETPFTVKYLGVDKETGHHLYQVIYNNTTVYLDGWSKGAQLISGGKIDKPHKWRIAKYSDFWTMRDEKNQSMIVNAAGESSKDGTKIIIWPQKGKAPNHAKLQFVPAP